MQPYNTQRPTLQMPLYGRNVQVLVAYLKTIPDREKRNRYALMVVEVMRDLYPQPEQVENLDGVLWDHLARLAHYDLDIDYPQSIWREGEDGDVRPAPLPRAQSPRIRQRVYGKIVEDLVATACQMSDRDERIRLFERCANHLKLQFHLAHPHADEDDNKIINDLIAYAGEAFRDDIYQVYLFPLEELRENTQYDASQLQAESTKKKKKKKKKA